MKHGYQPKKTKEPVTPPKTGSNIEKPISVGFEDAFVMVEMNKGGTMTIKLPIERIQNTKGFVININGCSVCFDELADLIDRFVSAGKEKDNNERES